MGKAIDNKLNDYVLNLLKGAGIKGEELAKHVIIYKAFYNEIKEGLDKDNVTLLVRKNIISSFLQFVVEFETICIHSYKPLSGSQSTAKEIISMHSKKSLYASFKDDYTGLTT